MPRRNASRKKRILSTNSGASLFRMDSKIIPAAENSLSTAVEVAGGVRYLEEREIITS